MKRKALMVISFIFAIITALAIFTACGGSDAEEKDSGSEAGTYYCDYNGSEYTLILGEDGKCTFTLTLSGDAQKGKYDLTGEALTLALEDGNAIAATYKNEKISFTYANVSYTFLKKVEYTVTFDTDGGTTVAAQKVVNGRKATKPEAPVKNGVTFVGWYMDTAHKNPFYFSQPITGDITLHARYEEGAETEFTVKVDFNYPGAVNPEPIPTIGNKVYFDMITMPERGEGYELLGWYASDFEDADKLTREITEETVIDQNMTIFAVWKDGSPVVNVTEDGVEISAEGTNLSYNIKVTSPDNTEQTYGGALSTGATTTVSLGLKDAAKGEYKIEVEVNGKTTTRYRNNKALARVSSFKVENGVLIFNAVANATEYLITVECGSEEHAENHVHEDLSLGNETSYNFSACAMREEGIKFTVTAKAEGYVDSVSEVYTYINRLAQPTGIEYDGATGIVSWDEVEHATAYRVTIIRDRIAIIDSDEVAETEYSLKTVDKGAIEIRITPVAFGWNSPEAASYAFDKVVLATPTNVKVNNSVVSWNAVEGATGGYEVVINGKAITVNETKYTVQAADFGGQQEANITVYALGASAAEKSLVSDSVIVRQGTNVQGLAYKGGVATWDAVFGAASYEVKIGSSEVSRTVVDPSAEIEFEAKGDQKISVRALINGTPGEWAEVSVTVYSVSFVTGTEEIAPIDDMFLAEGDPIALPSPDWIGYDFEGWYMGAAGEEGADVKYEFTKFGVGNLTLYAAFAPKEFTITLVAGDMGECVEEYKVHYRDTDFTLPIPTSNSVEYTFQGWYRGVNGTGAMFADANGGNTGTYTLLKDITLFASWTTPFVYQQVAGGYAISGGAKTAEMTEITIPETHNGLPVVVVEDFTVAKKLVTINIPNTVKTITLGSIGKAFEGITTLQAVNIIPVEDNRTPVYASQDGMVYTVEDMQLVFVPIGYKTPSGSTEARVPDGVRTIAAGALYGNRSITKLTIPGSVIEVQVEAIYGKNSTLDKLKEIYFEASTDENASLVLQDGAIKQVSTLTKITIPVYIEEFTSAKLVTCKAFADIDVSGGSAGDRYFAVENVLYRTVTSEDGRQVQEVAYYPAAKTAKTFEFPTTVTSIGAFAFEKATALTEITIPATITNIGESAFSGCTGIKTITFEGGESSNDLTIGDSAFSGDTGVTALTVSANVVKVGFKAFYMSKLTSITLKGKPGMQVDYADYAFFSVAADLKIEPNFPVINLAAVFASKSSATSLSPTAPKLKSIDITGNTNYKRVEDKSAEGYGGIFDANMTKLLYIETQVESFVIPSGITEISSVIFSGNKKLTSVTIPASVTKIADNAFQACTALKTVTFTAAAEGAERAPLIIGTYAFYGCTVLEQFTLPNETVEIGASAFYNCDKFTEFTIPGNVVTVSDKIFDGCDGLVTVIFQEGVQTLGDGIFNNCKKLENVSLPTTLTAIGEQAFFGCNVLEKIEVAENSPYFKTVDGALYQAKERPGTPGTYDAVTLLAVPIKCTGDETNTLNVPATVTKVATRAVQYNSGIVTVKFADRVVAYNEDGTEILGSLVFETYAFLGSTAATYPTKLKTVKLPAGLTEIGESAFSGCAELEEVNIPYTVSTIKASAFYNCNKLVDKFTFDETPGNAQKTPLVLEKQSLYYMQGLQQLALPERTVEIGVSAFASDAELQKITLPATISSIPKETFKGLTHLEEVVLPKAFENDLVIGEGAFDGCTALTKIGSIKKVAVDPEKPDETTDVYFLPNGVVEIGDKAFNNTGLTSIGLPATFRGVTDNDSYLRPFSNCTSLAVIVFDDYCAMETLPGGFASAASALRYVVFGRDIHLKTIGGTNSSALSEGPFNGTALETITIPASVETIKKDAFKGVTGLKEIKFENGSHLANVETQAFMNCAGLTEFTFPNVTNDAGQNTQIVVAEGAFTGCSSLETMNLSASIWNITGLFTGCSALKTITADENSNYFAVDDEQKTIFGLNSEGDRDTMLYVYGEVTGRVVVPEGTLEIATGAYKGQTGITELVLSSTVTKIGDSAFADCVNIQKVSFTIPQGTVSALSLIDDNAFNNCWSLASFEFEKARNLNYIGENAFYACALTKLDLSKSTMLGSNATGTKLNGIGEGAFDNNLKLGTEMIDPNAAPQDQYSVMLPSTLKTIGEKAFRYTAITRIDLSNTAITKISGSATGNAGVFTGCSQLKEVKLPVGLTAINGCAFLHTALETINLEELVNLTEINANAFGDTHLTEIVLPAAPIKTSSQSSVFSDNAKLQRVDMSAVKTANLSFGGSMFKNCPLLEEVVLPDNLTAIGDSMFSGCSSLTDITIPAGVKTIGASAFLDCSSLTELTFPESLTTIGGTSPTATTGAFIGTGLVTADFSQTNLTSIGGATFKGVETLTTVKFSEKITDMTLIGNYAFQGTGITSIELPASIKTVSVRAFQGCAELASVTSKATSYELAGYAFADCVKLKEFDFTKLSVIGDFAFQNTGFTTITVPTGIKMGSGWFSNCHALQSVTFPSTVNDVGSSMFTACENLTQVTFEGEINTIGSSAFSGCTALANFGWPTSLASLTTIGTSAFKGTSIASIDLSAATASDFKKIDTSTFEGCTELATVTLPENVTELAGSAFSGCTVLNSITMPGVTKIGASTFKATAFTTFAIGEKVESIGSYAFENCTGLTGFTVAEENEKIDQGENGEIYLVSADGKTKTLIAYPAAATTLGLAEEVTEIAEGALSGFLKASNELTIPETVKKINKYAFRGVALDKLTIAHEIDTISDFAFAESKIKEIVFTASGKALSNSVATSLFKDSTELTKVTFPAKDLTTIGSKWFDGCTSITTFDIPATVTTINGNAFKGTGITSLTIPATVTKFAANALSNIEHLAEVTINAKITSSSNAGTGVFANDKELTTVSFGASSELKYIGDTWFQGCGALTEITTWPTTLTNIGKSAFAGTGFVTITIPDTVTTIGDNLFDGCASLKNFTMPAKVTKVSSYMFQNCTALEWVYLTDKITAINTYSFNGCTELKFVNLPESVTTASSSFFRNTPKLHIFIPKVWAGLGTSNWWYPEATNHIYFESSLYEVATSRGWTWLVGTSSSASNFAGTKEKFTLDGNIHFGATYEQALKASGATDFPGYPAD